MKKIIIVLAITFCYQICSAKYIAIMGVAKVVGQSVTCSPPNQKTCAVVNVPDFQSESGQITIFDLNNNPIETFQFSSIEINETTEGTEVNWIP